MRSTLKKHEDDKWKWFLVCGVCRLARGIAVKPGRGQRLILKCKSSISSSLTELGYKTAQAGEVLSQDLLRHVPVLRENPAELRQWSLRSFNNTHPPEEWREISPLVAAAEIPSDAVCELRASALTETAARW
jgi:hypothetical protein